MLYIVDFILIALGIIGFCFIIKILLFCTTVRCLSASQVTPVHDLGNGKGIMESVLTKFPPETFHIVQGVDSPQCVICIDELAEGQDVLKFPCSHSFHTNCIRAWFTKHCAADCPLCKRNVLAIQDTDALPVLDAVVVEDV